MYASGSSNYFAEIKNFQELRYATPVEKGATEKHIVSSNLSEHISHHFTSATSGHDGASTKEATTGDHCRTIDCISDSDTMPSIDTVTHDGSHEVAKLPDHSSCPSKATTSVPDAADADEVHSTKLDAGARPRKDNGRDAAVLSEEILGSVTTFYPAGNLENGQTVRTSARVKHKMRMDSIRSSTPPLSERKEQTKSIGSSLAKTPNQPKQMRVVWSNHDKNLFFEGLNEYGKDFEAILNYLNSKKRRKDNTEQQVFKARDVRNLYYQFNQKVVKYIQFSDEVKKEAQELYALINYGEMRRKVPFQNKKYFHKLKELVYKGFTTVREKGKNIRIKTPPCRALRKLNQVEEWQEEIKLPTRVDVLLKPSSMEAWGRVQSLAQNPCVRVTVTIQKRLSAVLQLLQQKWRMQNVRLNERMEEMKRHSATISSKLVRQRLLHEIQQYSLMADEGKRATHGMMLVLHLTPAQNVIIHRPMISLTDFQSNTSICLNSYEQRIGVKVPGEMLCTVDKPTGCKDRIATANRRQRSDSGSEKLTTDCKKIKVEEGCKDTPEDKPFDMLVGQSIALNGLLKSPNASNESMELKEDCFEMDMSFGNDTPTTNCDALEALKSYESNDSVKVRLETADMTALPVGQSDNSSDGFVLIDGELQPVTKYLPDTADSSAGEEAIKSSNISATASGSSTTVVVSCNSTTTTRITVKKKEKCYRRKGESTKSSTSLPPINSLRPVISEEQMQRIRDGWTLRNVGDLTIGDLYIMFGAEMRVELEYDWVWEELASTQPTTVAQDSKMSNTEVSSGEMVSHPQQTADGETPSDGGKAIDTLVTTITSMTTMTTMTISKTTTMTSPNTTSCTLEDEDTGYPKEELGEQRCNINNTISRRLKQLLLMANLKNKDPKKRNTHVNATDRKQKRMDTDGGILPTQDECLQFKHPMLPVRTSSNMLVPDLHIPPRYRQSRWWRSRVNRHHALHPIISNSIRSPAPVTTSTATVTSLKATSTSAADVGTMYKPNSGDTGSDETGATVTTAGTKWTEQDGVILREQADVMPSDKSGQEPVASGSKDYTNPTSSNQSWMEDVRILSVPPASPGVTCNPATEVLQNDLSCLSLFDLSLPSTSSMMGNLFSTDDLLYTDGSKTTDIPTFVNQTVDDHLLDPSGSELSLTRILDTLEKLPPMDCSPMNCLPLERPTIDPEVDMSVISESTVDYISRFQDIAAEFRAQQHP